MQLTCKRDDLAKVLKRVGRAVPARTSLEVLYNFLLEAKDGRLRVFGTDNSTWIWADLEADIKTEGAVCVSAKNMAGLIDAYRPGGMVSMSMGATQLNLASGQSKNRLATISSEEFPARNFTENPPVTLDVKTFVSAIKEVAETAATDEARPLLTCIYIHVAPQEPSGTRLTMAASDGFRVTERVIQYPETMLAMTALLPATAAKEVAGMAGDTLRMTLKENRIEFLTGDKVGAIGMAAQLSEGTFPRYHDIVPAAEKLVVEFEAEVETLKKELAAAEYMAGLGNKQVNLIVRPDSLQALARSAEVGDSETVMPVAVTVHKKDAFKRMGKAGAVQEEDALEIGLNIGYLMTAIGNGGTERIRVQISGSTSPAVFRPVGRDDLFTVIMPMHLG